MNRRDVLVAGGAAGILGLTKQPMAQPSTDFFVPSEESAHQRTFMQWPVSVEVYPDRVSREWAQQTIADIANAVAQFEPVTMLAAKAFHPSARKKLSDGVELLDVPTEDLWCRDAGPTFVVNRAGDLAVSHIQFNGWGGKQVHRLDSQVARLVSQHFGLELRPSGLIGEAGGVEQDGHGLLLAHESSWVNDNRNPGLDRDDIEKLLLQAYGAQRMIWSEGVWGEDITDYHIDSLARFTGPGRGLINLPVRPDMNDPFHAAAVATHHRLESEGLDIEVIPEPVYRRVKSVDFVASYANYYVCNRGVIAAQFGDKETDEMARSALARHYPGREIVTLNVDALGEMGGGIHCATQQMPVA
jgi:agmatine deiminase